MPFLTVHVTGPYTNFTADTKRPDISIWIENSGIGPARLKSISVAVDGRPNIYTDINNLTNDMDIAYRFLYWTNYSGDEFIKEGQRLPLYQIKDYDDLMARRPDERLKALKEIADAMKKFHITIEYESVYGDRQTAHWP